MKAATLKGGCFLEDPSRLEGAEAGAKQEAQAAAATATTVTAHASAGATCPSPRFLDINLHRLKIEY
jgi:hypothetical protein